MDLRPLQSLKAQSSIEVTPSGMLIDVRLLQPKNVSSLILVTLLGILMDVSPLQKTVFTTDYYSIFYR